MSVQVIPVTPVAQVSASTSQVQGVWEPVPSTSSSSNDNSSATIIHGTHISVDLPIPPAAASTRISQHLPEQQENTYDAVDAFFGVVNSTRLPSRVRGTRDSRHDDAPPPYPHNNNDLPAYSSWGGDAGVKEPPTLAMFLFKYGFFFPLFWFIGCLILITPLRAPEDWEPTKTMEERAELIAVMRATEVKWARRCLIATLTLCAVALVVGLAVWAVKLKH